MKLNYYGFGIGVPQVLNECVLKVGGGFQGIDSSSFSVEREEVFSKFFFEVKPVDEMKMTGLHFVFEFARHPVVSTSCFHI